MLDDDDLQDLIRPYIQRDEPIGCVQRGGAHRTATRVALLDVLASVLTAARVLLEVAEDAVRNERARLPPATDERETTGPTDRSRQRAERIDLTY